MIRTKRGLNLPISGAPEQALGKAWSTRCVALLGCDYVGLKPTMLVAEGDKVLLGQPLFRDKKKPLGHIHIPWLRANQCYQSWPAKKAPLGSRGIGRKWETRRASPAE